MGHVFLISMVSIQILSGEVRAAEVCLVTHSSFHSWAHSCFMCVHGDQHCVRGSDASVQSKPCCNGDIGWNFPETPLPDCTLCFPEKGSANFLQKGWVGGEFFRPSGPYQPLLCILVCAPVFCFWFCCCYCFAFQPFNDIKAIVNSQMTQKQAQCWT